MKLKDCEQITDAGLPCILEHIPNLKQIEVSDLRKVSDKQIDELRENYPHLIIIGDIKENS